jgi:hypothetical protein
MKEMIPVLIGAICSVLGGCAASCIAIWYKAKKTRQIRMEEKAAEVQFEAQKKALVLIRKLRTSLVKRENGGALEFYYNNGFWFSETWMFLPDEFVEGWKSIGLKLGELERAKQAAKETTGAAKKGEYDQKAVGLGKELPILALKAENSLRREMGLKKAE